MISWIDTGSTGFDFEPCFEILLSEFSCVAKSKAESNYIAIISGHIHLHANSNIPDTHKSCSESKSFRTSEGRYVMLLLLKSLQASKPFCKYIAVRQ